MGGSVSTEDVFAGRSHCWSPSHACVLKPARNDVEILVVNFIANWHVYCVICLCAWWIDILYVLNWHAMVLLNWYSICLHHILYCLHSDPSLCSVKLNCCHEARDPFQNPNTNVQVIENKDNVEKHTHTQPLHTQAWAHSHISEIQILDSDYTSFVVADGRLTFAYCTIHITYHISNSHLQSVVARNCHIKKLRLSFFFCKTLGWM